MAQRAGEIRPRKYIQVETVVGNLQVALPDFKGERLAKVKNDDLVLSSNHMDSQQRFFKHHDA